MGIIIKFSRGVYRSNKGFPCSMLCVLIRKNRWVLDYHSEIVHDQTYLKNSQGIIYGKGSKEIKRGEDTAVIIIHGFMSYPTSHDITLDAIKDRLPNVDFYVPLLPHHARGLAKSKNFKAKDVEYYVRKYIKEKAKKYNKIYVIGDSFGSTVLSKLMLEQGFPKNITCILQAPAFHLRQNTAENRFKLGILSLFRNYCPYVSLGCGRDLSSVDDIGFEIEIGQVVSGHVIVPAVRNLFSYTLENIHNLRKLNQDFHIIMTPDDNKVDFDLVNQDCDQNSNCRMHVIPSGRHAFHWGKHKDMYQDVLVRLVKG